MQVSGGTPLVTGAASGIGRAMAERLVAAGMRVVLADIEEPQLRDVERELHANGAPVAAFPCDVSSRAAVEELFESVDDVRPDGSSAVGANGLLFGGAIPACPDVRVMQVERWPL